MKTKTKGKSNLKSKNKGKKVKKVKKVKDTGGMPSLVALTKETDEDDNETLVLHPIDFGDINEDCVVGIYSFRRLTNVEVQRKMKRTVKE